MVTLGPRLASRTGWTITAVGILFAAAYAASLVLFPKPSGRVVVGDAVHYYVYLRSVVFDGDLHFQNEYMRLYSLAAPGPTDTSWIFEPLPTGYVRNLMPIGSAIVWAPLYLVTVAAALLGYLLGIGPAPDGFSRAFQATAGFSGIAAATLGAWLACGTARSIAGGGSALWATLAVWLGSSALYYSLVSPTYSHASSMLATSLLLFAWWRTIRSDRVWRYALVGALVGFATLVRWQDAVFALLPVADIAWDARHGSGSAPERLTRAVRNALACAAAAVAVFTPQMVVWWVLYGDPLLVPQGAGFMRWSEPHLLDVLFSTFRGLFTWTPVLVLAVAGLWALGTTRRRVAVTLSVVLVASWYTNAAVADWWAGEAFGARRFVSCFPIFVVGLSALLVPGQRVRALGPAIAFLVVANLLLLFQYQVFLKGWRDLAAYPDTLHGLWVERFLVPVRVVARLLESWTG